MTLEEKKLILKIRFIEVKFTLISLLSIKIQIKTATANRNQSQEKIAQKKMAIAT